MNEPFKDKRVFFYFNRNVSSRDCVDAANLHGHRGKPPVAWSVAVLKEKNRSSATFPKATHKMPRSFVSPMQRSTRT
jgi:hypothetical protein